MSGIIKTADDFSAFVSAVESGDGYRRPLAFGIGIAHQSSAGAIIDTFFPVPNFQENYGTAAVFAHVVGHTAGTASYPLDEGMVAEILACFEPFKNDGKVHANINAITELYAVQQSYNFGLNLSSLVSSEGQCVRPQKVLVVSFIDVPEFDPGPQTVSDAYLRLHLLSHRKVKPHGIKLDGQFGVLPNNVWTNEGPVALEDLPARRHAAMGTFHSLKVYSVDKFPSMVDYVVPSGVRIADTSRVRLGAYIGPGTTIMHEGFVNFNAGTEGPGMIEGRISAGVFVGASSDLGGGCSTMGTLSGGGNIVISVGEKCLIGANAGIGIPLGDRCTVEAGLYVTASTKVQLKGADGLPVRDVYARDLSGQSDLLFRRNSLTGIVECLTNKTVVELNEMLHAN